MNLSLFVAFCPHCGDELPLAAANRPAGDHWQTKDVACPCGFLWRFDVLATPIGAS